MNALETLEKVTGFKPKEVNALWEEVRANKAKLDGCKKPHDFSICLDRRTKQPIENPTPHQHFGAYWQCSKCGGRLDAISKIQYCRGLNDAKANGV